MKKRNEPLVSDSSSFGKLSAFGDRYATDVKTPPSDVRVERQIPNATQQQFAAEAWRFAASLLFISPTASDES